MMNNPSLALTFLGDDLEVGHLASQTIQSSFIVKDSVSFHYQLLNGLKSSSNQVELLILQGCPSIEDIISTEGDIKAVLKDGGTVAFTGYVSTNFSWSVTASGEKALSISLEDTGTRLLGKPFIQSGYHLFNCSASDAIITICTAAGIRISSRCQAIATTVTKTAGSDATCRDILDQMLYELGYVYRFDNQGELLVFKIDCTSTSGLPTLDGDDFCVSNGKAITLSKKIRKYKSARVSFKSLGTASRYLVYRNTSGKDDSHPYCNMELPAFAWFDGTDVYSDSEHSEHEADSFREPALIQACNAESESRVVGSGTIIAVSNVETVMTATNPNVTGKVESAGGAYMRVEAHNPGNIAFNLTRLDAYADVIYEKDTSIVRTANVAQETEQSDSLLKEELSYVHDRTLAQAHANLLGQYHRYCNSQYTFSSKVDVALGSLIRLHDTVFTGLDVNVILIAKSWNDRGGIISYTAVGISVFNLEAQTYIRTVAKGNPDLLGKNGRGITTQEYLYAVTATQVIPDVLALPSIPTLSALDKYLWRKEVVSYTDGSSTTTISLIGVYGDTGSAGLDGQDAYSITVISDAGDKYRSGGSFSSTLTARVFLGGEEITDSCGERFRWLRHSEDGTADTLWNSSHYSLSSNTLAITQADLIGRTSFEAQYITDSDLS